MEYSEKFKNRASGIKESLNLSKILGGLTAKSNNYKLQNDSFNVRGNKKNKKNPQISTVGPNQSGKLKSGDSSADILAKMYNFMEKNYQDEVKKYEIEKAFRQEQIDEDKKRHKKLIEGLMSKEEKMEEPKKGESWIEKMLSGMKSALGIILKPLSLILKAIPLIGSLFSSIGGLVLEVIGNNVLKVFELLIKPIAKLIVSLSTSLIEKLIVPFIGFVSRQILGLAKKIPGIAALAEVMTTGAGLGLAAIGVGAAGLYATQKYEEYGDEIEIGPKAAQIAKQMDGLREQYQKSRQNPHTTPEALNKIKEKFNELASQYYAEKVKYEQEVLVPRMKEAGYQVSGTDENKSLKGLDNKELRMTGTVYGQKNTPVSTAPLKFIKLDDEGRGNVASTLDFVRAVKIPEKLKEGEEYVTGAAEEKFQEIKAEYLKNHPETNEILNKFNTVSEELNNLTNSMIEKSKEASTTVINKVNNIGNLKDEIKQLQPSRARDDDSTIIKVITNSTIPV